MAVPLIATAPRCVGWWWLVRRDWRAGAIAAGLVGGYLPWFLYQDRTIYTFYAIAFEPWVVLAVTFLVALGVAAVATVFGDANITAKLPGGAEVGASRDRTDSTGSSS